MDGLQALFGDNMDAQILIDKARMASEEYGAYDPADRLSYRVGCLEATLRIVCGLLGDAEEILYRQRELIEQIKKGHSADL